MQVLRYGVTEGVMSCENEAATILRESGHKLTPQRLLVVSALRHAATHMSAAQLLEQVQSVYPYVDVSTVYRTLAVLKDLHLATETDMGGGELTYEWSSGEGHLHLICRRCGGVQQLRHGVLDQLSGSLREDYGFAADLEHLAIFGVCQTCAAGAR
jgi:Fur family transcriptional regulator, ferric uptake regulator